MGRAARGWGHTDRAAVKLPVGRRTAGMGAEQSTESWQQPPEDSRLAANPPEAWYSRQRSNGASLLHTLPAYGTDFATDGATDSDSEVEYDKQSTSATADAAMVVSSAGESREPAAAFEAVSQQLVQPLVESSEPAWAEGLSNSQACSSRLELQFVYGYDCRRNLCLLPSGEVAFPAANLVVVFEARAQRQRFYAAHDAAVKCMTLHPRGVLVASGQAGDASRASVENASGSGGTGGVGAPHICVWQPDGLETVALLSSLHHAGVCELAFSPDGERLASIGADAEHTLGLWDWRRGTLLASSRCSEGAAPCAIFGLAFSPAGGAAGGGSLIATCGAQHLALWQQDAHGGGLSGQPAQLAPAPPSRLGRAASGSRAATVCCVTFLPSGLLLGGTSRGEVWCWAGTSLTARYRAHTGPVYCLELQCATASAPASGTASAAVGPPPDDGSTSGHWLLSAGKDGKLRLWPTAAFASAAPMPARRVVFPSLGAPPPPPPSAAPVRVVDLRMLAATLTDAAGHPRLLGAPSVRALHWAGERVLMGTRAGALDCS